MRVLLSLLIIFAASSALSQGWYENNKPAPDTEWRQSDGNFGIIQFLTVKPDEFLENWAKPTAGVNMSTTDITARGQPIFSFIMFTGCQVDEKNNCNLDVTYKVLKPSGEIYYFDDSTMELWIDKPSPLERELQLGINYLGTVIEPEDPLGEYQIHATVRDLNSGSQLTTVRRFTAIEADQFTKVPQQGYTTTTLREPIFKADQVVSETANINKWLITNYGKLSEEQMKGPREQIYYLIDSHIKSLYARESIILSDKPDSTLETLFSWVEPLGVYGGALAYNAVKSPNSEKREPSLNIPDQISLELNRDLFSLSSMAQGWEVKIPYYFMIHQLSDFTAANGQRTQLISLSTGAALGKSGLGHSQASLMLMFSPDADFQEFSNFWMTLMDLGENPEELALGVADRKSFHGIDTAIKLHKEITMWQERQGAFAVAYLGMDGTYQWNRPHFLDFLRALKISQPSPSN